METKRISLIFILCLIFVFAFVLAGCEEEQDGVVLDDDTGGTVSVDFSITIQDLSAGKMRSASGTVDEVASVQVSVQDSATLAEVVPDIDLTETSEGSGIWEGTIDGLPTGVSLDFIANAFDEGGAIIFTDTVVKSLNQDGTNDTLFEMESIDDGVQPEIPKIVSASIPSEVETGSTRNSILFQVTHSTSYEYRLEVERGTIASSTTGIHAPGSALTVLYNAPSTLGDDTIRIWVKDPNIIDTVYSEFSINIVQSGSDGGIDVVFGPAIAGMNYFRLENALMISVETDPAAGLYYTWSGTGSFAAFYSTDNPIIIDPFDNGYSGDITVTVADADGLEASVTRTIAAGDFPYSIVPPPDEPDDIEGTVLDPATGLRWQDNLDKVKMKWDDAVVYCEEGLELGGFIDWRLPTLEELGSAYQHRDIFSNYFAKGYWSSVESKYRSRFAWYLRFSSGYERVSRKKRKHRVRCVR
ncbi:MAG: DUF1566 domain-containing protein [Proteobacteria bacterium]|nr:DUF1566 domain-containing protein [Pseudomonadota bacterium]